jgi:hypothetical protein
LRSWPAVRNPFQNHPLYTVKLLWPKKYDIQTLLNGLPDQSLILPIANYNTCKLPNGKIGYTFKKAITWGG